MHSKCGGLITLGGSSPPALVADGVATSFRRLSGSSSQDTRALQEHVAPPTVIQRQVSQAGFKGRSRWLPVTDL